MNSPNTPGPGNLPWKRVLLTTDFSEDSLVAWEQACALFPAGVSECIVLHVTEPSYEGLRIHTEALHAEMKHAAGLKLAELASGRLGAANSVTRRVEEGRAATVICDVAAKSAVDIIILSSHGRSGLKHILLGSVAEDVVRHAPCSVLVVPVGKR
jgi:universal stress protein A